MKVALILVLVLVAIMVTAFHAEARCSSNRPIRRVYVIRRGLKLVKSFTVPRYCVLAHSGLIIEMTDGRQCVLEYLGDGKSHLYDARPSSTRNCWWWRRCKVLKMKDESGTKYTWTRQKRGTAWRLWYNVTPQQAQRQMQSLMGSNYDLITNNCHLGQERLRRKWGMYVAKHYVANVNAVCSCKLPRWLPYAPLNRLLQLVRNYCRIRRG